MPTDDPQLEPESSEESNPDDLVTIRKIQDLHDASLAKTTLESAGIECFLADAYMIGRVGQVRLQVRREDSEAAKAILDGPIPESFEVEGGGKYEQPRCPSCGSLDVNMEPYPSDAWMCQACKHLWQAEPSA